MISFSPARCTLLAALLVLPTASAFGQAWTAASGPTWAPAAGPTQTPAVDPTSTPADHSEAPASAEAIGQARTPASAESGEPLPGPVRITTLGGFLGYLDGQRAAPGERYGWTDKPRGGLLGAADWLIANRKPGDVLVLGANNLPHDSVDIGLHNAVLAIGRAPASYANAAHPALRPDAVGFGIDDFLRALRPGEQADALYKAMSDPRAAPFVVSNGFVRLRQSRLNTIDAPRFHLELPRDESIAWIRGFDVTCDPCPNVTAILQQHTEASGTTTVPVIVTPDRSFRRMTLAVAGGLRPDASYQLRIDPHDGRQPATFGFRTHMALAPTREETDPDVPGRLLGLPIRYVTRPAAVVTTPSDSCLSIGVTTELPIVIVGMTDPAAHVRLAARMWEWEGGTCPVASCEIDFMPPLAALDVIKGWTAPEDPCAPPNAYVMLSGLTDAALEPVLTQNADIRWVILDYDARTLGQHRGRDATVNQSTPDSTQLWARTQWVGSSTTTLAASVTWRRRPGEGGRPSVWELTNPSVDTAIVEGKALDWTVTPQPGRPPSITYFAEGDRRSVIAGPLDAYPPFPGMLDRTTTQGRMWTDLSEMAAFVLDIMRRRAHADLAVIPAEFIDDETLAWLADEYQQRQQPLDWLSRFVTARTFFRDQQIVTVEVPGSELANVVNGLVGVERERFLDVYGAGFGTNRPLPRIDALPIINGRELNPDHFYRLAMPQYVAEQQGLPATHVVIESLLNEIDGRMHGASGAAPATTQSLGEQLEEQYARKPRLYLSATPARIDFAQEVVEEGNPGVFGKIPLEGRSAQSQLLWGFSGRAEMGIDYRSVAYRLTGEATFAKQTIANTISYPSDEWTAGARVDWKLERLGIRRVFGGLFRQSWFSDHVSGEVIPVRSVANAIDPSTGETLPEVLISGPPVNPRTARPLYDFLRTGVDLDNGSWKALRLSGVGISLDFGRVNRDRDSVRIGDGAPLSLDTLYRDGLDVLLNRAFTQDPAGFSANPTVEFGYAGHDQRRVQLDGGVELAPQTFLHGARLTAIARYRRYFQHDERVNFTPDRSLWLRSLLEWRVLSRVTVGPFLDYYRVEAKGADGPFIDRKIGFAIGLPVHLAMHPGVWLR